MKKDDLIVNDDKAVYALMRDKTAAEYIDTMSLTTKTIERFCQKQTLDVQRRKNEWEIEERTSPPLMAGYFFYYVYHYQRLPKPKEFINFYKMLNEKWITEKVKPEHIRGLNGRLTRFYASIVREFHFYHLVKESKQFDRVSYTLRQDIEHKIDVLVEKGKGKYGVQLRVDTRKAKHFANQKSTRGYVRTDAVLIDLPIDLDKAKRIKTLKDDFVFYNSSYIDKILQYVPKEEDEGKPDWHKKMRNLYGD